MYLGQSDVASVGQGGDDEPGGVAEVLVPVLELGVADVGEAVELVLVPPVPQLGLPHEGQGRLDLVRDQLADNVPEF